MTERQSFIAAALVIFMLWAIFDASVAAAYALIWCAIGAAER